MDVSTSENQRSTSIEITAPVNGMVVPVTEVNDDVFSSEALGKGVGIIPDDGKVYAPFDCVIEMLSDTKHAIGLRSDDGIVALIHIGIDTVKLEGKGFTPYVKEGDHIEKGSLISVFDKELLVKEGYDPTVIFIVTELEDDQEMEIISGKHVNVSETVMKLHMAEVTQHE